MYQQYYKKCCCEYNGTAYSGWQFQKEHPSIQNEIETALSKLYSTRIPITGSGRTDAGVHAIEQVFSYKTNIHRDNHSIVQALNSMLPRDIAILSAEDCDKDFNAQFSAKNKTYRYIILNRQSRAALDYNRAWFRRTPIDVDYMNGLLQALCGTHDFSSFCVTQSLKENCVRTINFINAERKGDQIVLRVNATGFLHNMVRIIVGTAVDFTIDKRSIDDMTQVLEAKDRRLAGITAPAQGLYLEKVFY